MKRRTLIKSSLLLGISSVAPFKSLFATPVKSNFGNSSHKFKLGILELMVFTDGHIVFPTVQPSFAPDASPAEVLELLKTNFLPTTHADLSMNVLVVKNEDRLILIDTGCGTLFGGNSGWLTKSLFTAGIKPEHITDIILTHAHPDHIGGLLDSKNELTFTNANIYLSRIEKAFWEQRAPDLSKSRMDSAVTKNLIVDTAHRVLNKINSRLHLFEDGDRLFNCLKLQVAPGHTPGHSIITVYSDGQELVHVADLVHSPVLTFAHPEWGFDGDADFNLAVTTRKKVLREFAINRKQVFSYHLPWPGLGHVKQDGTGFEWVQNTFAVPD
ncbi:MBL fold metallo-hydrolase [Mucilaginibacter sp. Bleaf8]|uniref:MBL fold metallo-hydrolase n=1 Tax=Mucilaginibacter sp. Bleaf8 TaxID=2834430 RepID=UPI001BCC6EB4|nr:MBL fold metallo-hydrolase [Mucilaginibacter sp. Bleaf8]MBS7566983.1 MBL fold metallo-hydrolase [Mucilaginibacter sp. Bleaf8]